MSQSLSQHHSVTWGPAVLVSTLCVTLCVTPGHTLWCPRRWYLYPRCSHDLLLSHTQQVSRSLLVTKYSRRYCHVCLVTQRDKCHEWVVTISQRSGSRDGGSWRRLVTSLYTTYCHRQTEGGSGMFKFIRLSSSSSVKPRWRRLSVSPSQLHHSDLTIMHWKCPTCVSQVLCLLELNLGINGSFSPRPRDLHRSWIEQQLTRLEE